VRRLLTEIRASDLRFTSEETAAFLWETATLTLTPDDVKRLEQRTEGWVAGLQLAAISLQERTDVSRFVQHFTGSNVLIIDYLVEEVLQKLPESQQAFLLRTAILERFCAALCTALTGCSDAQVIIEQLQRANLFLVPLDDNREWYRYHHLFAEVLKNRLQQGALNQSSSCIVRLHFGMPNKIC